MRRADMEERLLTLTDRYRAALEGKLRPWRCWRCATTNAPRAGECSHCGSSGAPNDPDAVAEYRELHARWMAA